MEHEHIKTAYHALLSLRPSAGWSIDEEGEITWLSPDITQPTQAEIDAEIIRLQTEYDSQEYARDRVPEYPDIGDQLDALFHAGVFPDDMAAKIQAVKDAHPKPEE